MCVFEFQMLLISFSKKKKLNTSSNRTKCKIYTTKAESYSIIHPISKQFCMHAHIVLAKYIKYQQQRIIYAHHLTVKCKYLEKIARRFCRLDDLVNVYSVWTSFKFIGCRFIESLSMKGMCLWLYCTIRSF